MTEVKVLLEGYHKDVEGGLIASSSITLIKSNSKNIIVDTGAFACDDKKIINALQNEGLKPEQIDIVITTHQHWDHVANVNLFKKVKWYKNALSSVDVSTNLRRRENIEDEFKITEDVKIILTPGHTRNHISVVVNTEKGKVVIAGDAISDEYWADLNKKYSPDAIFSKEDVERYDNSRKKILEIADYVIPGHGKMFKVEK